MIYSLSGKLIYTDLSCAVIECGGVGYKCNVSLNTLQSLPPVNQNAFLLTHLNVREDAVDLFGFSTAEELDMFKLITSVSGVGPKVAMSILSEFTPDKLCIYIAGGDSKSITRASGVGAKLAQRIVLELKDKVGSVATESQAEVEAAVIATSNSNTADAVAALVSLGFSQAEASVAVGKLDSNMSVEQLIKEGLRSLSKF